MFGRRTGRTGARPSNRERALIETLESRRLLSTGSDVMLHSDAVFLHPSATSSSVQGYTPVSYTHLTLPTILRV